MSLRAVHLLLLLPGLLVGARVAAAEGDIRIRCTPEHALLGSESDVELRIELEPSATELELFVSRGEVGPLTQVEPGVYRATYVPPRQTLPQRAIIAAVARGPQGSLEGWTALSLWGQGIAEVRTRAGAPATLRVGEQSFGPVVADKWGIARIPVSVPPGVYEAFFESRRIDLGVPPQPLVHALIERRTLRADREELVGVRLYTLEGEPWRWDDFRFSVTRGHVDGTTEVRPGVFLLWWRVPSGPSGPLRLKGTVSGEERWSFQVEAEAVPGPAQRFEMRVEPEVLVASEEAKVEVVVSAWDATGNPTGAGLRLESSLGGEAMLEEQQPGRFTGVLEVAPAFRGSEELEVRLLADGGTTPVLTRRVGLRAAAPEKVRVEPLRSALVADGKAEVAWRISVEDRFGNPVREAVPELPPALLASGTLQPGGEAGTYELRYVPPAADENHSAELEVRVGEVSGRGALTLLRNRPLLLAVRSGVVSNFADVVAPSAGLRLELWPGRPLPDLGMLLDTGYLRFTRTGGEVVPGFSGRNELLEASMALARRLRLGGGVEAWVAGGPTLARVRSRARLGEGPALEEGTWVFGAQALVGGSLPLGPGFPFLEARFFWFDDPSLHVLRGSLRGGGLHLGYRLELF